MKISYRLYLTVTPAILGVLLMGGLVYWGQYERSAPVVVMTFGAIAVVTSLILAWTNARFIARRIERLAGSLAPATTRSGSDELDRIAQGMDRLSSDMQTAEAERTDRERNLETRTRDYGKLLATIADDTAKRLEEIRLPLHILLENRFGELNENQEEMLGAARAAAESADAQLVNLKQIADLDLGEQQLRRDRIKPSDLIDSLRPMLVAAAESVGATVELNVAPLLPAIIGDRARLQDALATMLGDAVRSGGSGSRVRLSVEQRDATVETVVDGAGQVPASVRWAAASRLVAAHGGAVERRPEGVRIQLPLEIRMGSRAVTDLQ